MMRVLVKAIGKAGVDLRKPSEGLVPDDIAEIAIDATIDPIFDIANRRVPEPIEKSKILLEMPRPLLPLERIVCDPIARALLQILSPKR